LLILFYGALVIIRSSFVQLVIVILLLEVLSWLISIRLDDMAFKYLLIQAYFIILSIIRIFFLKELLLRVFLFKLGAPPFHLWYLGVSKFLRTKILWFFITFHKFLPLLILRIFFNKMFTVVFIVITAMALIGRFSLIRVLLLSSSSHIVWGILLAYFSMLFTRFYWLFYTFVNSGLITRVSFFVILITVLIRISFLLLSGIPPFVFFTLKFCAVCWVLPTRARLVWVLLCCRVVNILVYLRRVLRAVLRNIRNLIFLLRTFFNFISGLAQQELWA